MYDIVSESFRVAYGDLCYMKRNILQLMVSTLIGPLLYLVAFGYGMRAGDSQYLAYVIPGIIAISSMNSGFGSSSQKIVVQRLFHTSFDDLILSPMHTPSVILGKSIMGILRGLASSLAILVLGVLLTDGLHLTPWLVVTILLSTVTFSFFGIVAGLLANSSATMSMFSSVVILPMSFMCGTLFDVDVLPSFISAVVWALPLTHTTELIRDAALCSGIEWVSLAVVLVYAAVMYAVCHVIIKRKLY